MGSERIGIDAREFVSGDFTGIGRFLHNYLTYALHARPHYKFILYGNQYTIPPLQGKNLDFRNIQQWNTLWWDQIALSRTIRKDKITLFFTPLDKIPCFLNCPTILTIHDLLFFSITHLRGFQKYLYEYLYLMSRSMMLKKANVIITVSNFSRDDIVKIFRVPAEKIRVVYNGVPDHYQPVIDGGKIERIKVKYRVQGRYILYVGNFKPHKNVFTLIEAYQKLSSQYKIPYNLVLAGKKNKDSETIQNFIHINQMESRVFFTDFVSEEDLPSLYSGADIFVFPSLYEGFGIPPLEAMACGTPVIVSNQTSLPEIIDDAGIITDARLSQKLAESMLLLLTNEDLKKEMRERGFKRVQKFTVKKSAEGILKVMEEVIKKDS